MAIHGTNDPKCIGHKISGGCVRMHNKDIVELIEKFAETGMDVIIEN
jgi:lipoprotein-anchoring transpeptidase ErfK/SrfK